MLIIVRTRHPAYMPASPSGEAFELVDREVQEGKTTQQRIRVLQGKVLDPFWQAASQKYLTWEPSRLDLLAILHKNTDAE